ncbi:MbtH family protein [Pelosinus propionicus]|uniref:MbtH protein n=1 Tax=Pelosinus propionicus DSM 13327 TaxID=1123291 RepID=A0A1I4JM32_9FIRM|nr:MbtH family protein [Pelosinus propionicus]SFL67658.1 MbtH protein [Pelosinus propionicus DSM 13327]
MINPFEDENGTYYVLNNQEGQYSLWPVFVDVPAGWSVIYGEESRMVCLDYISSQWSDMRPNSLKSVTSLSKESDNEDTA